MKIFIDFDGVILNTEKFIVDLDKVYFKNGVLKQKLEEYKKIISDTPKSKGNTYKPERVAAFVKKDDKKCQKKILSDVSILLKNLRKYVFSDALIFLKKVSRENLFLLSCGDVKFQKDKVFGSGTDNYFSKITVSTQNKISLILKTVKKHKSAKEEKIFFIDDKLKNLGKIEKMDREIVTIWIKRFNTKNSKLIDGKADYEVGSLEKVLKIIKN